MELSLFALQSDDCKASSSFSSYSNSEMELSPLCEKLVNSRLVSRGAECDAYIQSDKNFEDYNAKIEDVNEDFDENEKEREQESKEKNNNRENESEEEEVEIANARKRIKL